MQNKLRVLTLLITTIPPAQFSLPAIPPAHNASCNSSCRLLAAAFCISGQSSWWEPNLVSTDGSEQISHFHLSPRCTAAHTHHLSRSCTHTYTYTATHIHSSAQLFCKYTFFWVPAAQLFCKTLSSAKCAHTQHQWVPATQLCTNTNAQLHS